MSNEVKTVTPVSTTVEDAAETTQGMTVAQPQELTGAVQGSTAMQSADEEDDREGLEDFAKEDISIPRLALAQALSPEVTDGDPNRVEGLAPGMLFNSMTKQIYGTEVFVQIIRKDKLRAMEFNPIDSGGGVKDPDVPLDDPRLKWGNTGDKKKDKPVATLFRDYFAVLLPDREMVVLSFKSSGIKVAKALGTLIVLRGKSTYWGRYRIGTGLELKPKPHYVYKVSNAGDCTPEDRALGKQVYANIKDLDLSSHVDRGGGDAPADVDTVTEIDPNAPEM